MRSLFHSVLNFRFRHFDKPPMVTLVAAILVLNLALFAASSILGPGQTGRTYTLPAGGNRPEFSRNNSNSQKQGIAQNLARQPLSFEINQGQTDKQVKFMARGSGYTFFLTGNEAVLSLNKFQPG